MQGHFWHRFLAQFFMLFHMVALVLLSMVAFLTIFLLAENLHQPIRVFEIGGYWSCHGEQNASYHVKEDKNLNQKMVSKVTLHFVWGHIARKQTVVVAYNLSLKMGNFSEALTLKWAHFGVFYLQPLVWYNHDFQKYLYFLFISGTLPTKIQKTMLRRVRNISSDRGANKNWESSPWSCFLCQKGTI